MMTDKQTKNDNAILVFVYNADSGLFNGMADYLHKIFQPKTYSCSLCRLSYGNLGARKKWKEFISTLPYDVDFLHKDQYETTSSNSVNEFPVLLKRIGETEDILVSSIEMNKCKLLKELIELIRTKISPQ